MVSSDCMAGLRIHIRYISCGSGSRVLKTNADLDTDPDPRPDFESEKTKTKICIYIFPTLFTNMNKKMKIYTKR